MDWTPWLMFAGVMALFGLRGLQGRLRIGRVRRSFDEGLTALNADRPAEAEASFRKCLRLSPGTASLHRMLGRSLAAQARFVEAAEAMAAAAALEPKNADAILEHGLMLAHCGADSEAATAVAMQRALSLDPGLRAVLRNAAQLDAVRLHPAVKGLLADED